MREVVDRGERLMTKPRLRRPKKNVSLGRRQMLNEAAKRKAQTKLMRTRKRTTVTTMRMSTRMMMKTRTRTRMRPRPRNRNNPNSSSSVERSLAPTT